MVVHFEFRSGRLRVDVSASVRKNIGIVRKCTDRSRMKPIEAYTPETRPPARG